MTTETGTSRPGRVHLPELDGVRGLAIAGVMALHFVGAIAPTGVIERAAAKISGYGVWGVDLFFVLSGFLITGILLDSKGSPRYLRDFYMRRTLRIFPLYYGVLLVLMVLIPGSALARLDPQLIEMRRLQGWIWPYLTNVYLGSQTSWSIPYVSHFWSLAIEEHFYLVWPFLILLLSRKAAMRTCVALALFSLGLRIWFTMTEPQLLYASVLTPCRLDALCAGGWFALSARGEHPFTLDRAMRWIAVSGVAILALSTWHAVLTIGDVLVLPLRTTLLAVFFGLFIYISSRPSGWPIVRAGLRVPALRSLGKYSYGLYVYHGIVAYAIDRYGLETILTRVVGMHLLAAGMKITFGVTLSMLLAVASYKLFEVRFLALKDRFENAAGTSSQSSVRRSAIAVPT